MAIFKIALWIYMLAGRILTGEIDSGYRLGG